MTGPAADPRRAVCSAARLAAWTGGQVVAGNPRTLVTEFSHDSRQIRPGACFVALAGARADGHAFVGEAAARGATCALVSRPVAAPPGLALVQVPDTLLALGQAAAARRAAARAAVVAVTGSVGKTTTKELIHAVLAPYLRTLKSPGNLNSEVGLPLVLLNELRPDHEAVVLEMGMRAPGEIAYLASIARPRVGVVTNVGPSHLELLGTLENIARAKAELVAALPAQGLAVLNADDLRVVAMARDATCPVMFYGRRAAGERFVSLRAAQTGTPRPGALFPPQILSVVTHAGAAEVHLPLPGSHNAMNALAAMAVALAFGLTPAQAAAALQDYRPAHGRLRLAEAGGVRILDDTYNAAPASVMAALAVLAELAPGGRRVAVLGDMFELGPASEEGHRTVGAACARSVHLLVAVGEAARWYVEGARGAGLSEAHHFPDRAAACRFLWGVLRPGDTVLVKGSRGMLMEEIVAQLENHLPRLFTGGI